MQRDTKQCAIIRVRPQDNGWFLNLLKGHLPELRENLHEYGNVEITLLHSEIEQYFYVVFTFGTQELAFECWQKKDCLRLMNRLGGIHFVEFDHHPWGNPVPDDTQEVSL